MTKVAVSGVKSSGAASTRTKRRNMRKGFGLKVAGIALGTVLLGACGSPPPPIVSAPPPPPPPAKVVETIPFRPVPPGGASYVMALPGKGSDGRWETINRNLTEDEVVWHFRSGWNVAALNCTAAQYQPVLDAYSVYIKQHSRALKRVNDRLDGVYRSKAGSRKAGIVAREGQMTSVYNFFALPPARRGFCDAALDISNRALANPPSDPIAFAKDNFILLETPFDAFFTDYANYQQLSAEWDAKYGERYGASQRGWQEVQRARANGVPVPTVENTAAATMVTDPLTGAQVPASPAHTPQGLRR